LLDDFFDQRLDLKFFLLYNLIDLPEKQKTQIKRYIRIMYAAGPFLAAGDKGLWDYA
jgi:hypothetical protein